MDKFSIFRDIAIILAISIPIIYLFKKTKISIIVGFLVTGIVIGPSGFNFISKSASTDVMAELGVILLMFTIGLELSIDKLMKIKKYLLIFGSMQVLGTITITIALCSLLNIPIKQSIFWGLLVSLSSTAIVLRIFREKDMMDSPHGKIGVSILIFQDLFVIPVILLLPLLSNDSSFNLTFFITKILTAAVILTFVILFSRYIIPKLLFVISKLRTREVFTSTMIVILFGTAYLTYLLGISFSIGAFIAGFIIAESDFSHEIQAEIITFRDIFNSLFFVSIGLLLNISALFQHIYLGIAISSLVIIGKAVIIIAIVRIFKFPIRTAMLAGFALAQVGEFSFVLASTGLSMKIFDSAMYNIFLCCAVFSMIVSPFLMEYAPALLLKLKPSSPKSKEDETDIKMSNHVIIAGFGLNGKNLAHVLKETGIPYYVVELNPETIAKAKQDGEKILYGDITRKEILEKLQIKSAKAIVYAISDPQSTRISLHIAKSLNKNIYIIVRTRYVSEVDELISLGADEVIPEEFETSLQMFSRVLSRFHIPLNIIARQIQILRQGSYEMLRQNAVSIPANYLNELLAQGVTESYFIESDNPHINKTIKDVNLRAKSGATILAIVRKDKSITNPTGDFVLLHGDILVLTGTHQAVDDAFEVLGKAI